MGDKQTLAFEIGTEEIPAFDLKAAAAQLARLVPEALDAQRIPHGEVTIYSSPRRLIALVAEVAASTERSVDEFRGPKAQIAFDEAGVPTKAAEGFARGKGLDASQLERREEDGVEYVFATVETPAQEVAELLPSVLHGLIESISWPKSMRWGTMRALFSRPVRWICAMLGDTVIPVTFAGVSAQATTRGHRFLSPGPHAVPCADQLLEVVRSAFVVPSEAEREQVIRAGVAEAERATGCTAQLPDKTLTEVINLSEYPTVMVGTFDAEFLAVPEEIIVDAMLMHQRYFPLYDARGALSNNFIIVSNGDPAQETTIVDGNERVVAARLYDAKFFYEEDLKKPLEAYVAHLDEVVFQEQLGTMRAKTERVSQLAERIALDAALTEAERGDVARAAYLAKADLVTNAVVEFTSVQGVMGSYYAEAAGEGERVARAIAEHYMPRFSGDAVPSDAVGRVVALADKVDTVCGLFAVDQAPTGSSDPFALRRAALGIIAIMQAGVDISLARALDDALRIYRESGLSFDKEAVIDAVQEFFLTRTRVLLKDAGNASDAIDAVIATGVTEPIVVIERVSALEAARAEAPETFTDLAIAYARANNLSDADAGSNYDAALFSDSEHALADAVSAAQSAVDEALDHGDYRQALDELARLRGPIDDFFEQVMVMDEDQALRQNRLRLLNRFIGVFKNVADFGCMAKAK
ncbi:glycine--tRNA ligase subunit beta [Adlercreutzia murintestinalis]|uniref:glycine--tRNA ligase subunit beta n=1 Tax=Adlercreutzia murintestinalis TaxID=2941325 RepID=UPI002040D581|nr:glycine--tRNA ligase subunit beta [Adlercreutzia murintestinalis]